MFPQRKTMMIYLYQWLLDALYLPARFAGIGRRGSFRERLGFYPPEEIKVLAMGYNLWIHAASAGEVNAILSFSKALREKCPDAKLVLTTTSATGKKLALEKRVADAVFLAPLDMTTPLRRAFQAFRPTVILIAETEFWPNWLFRAAQNQVPVLLVNGRVSDKSFPAYQRLRAFFGPALRCFNQCLVQTSRDRDKLTRLGVPEKRIQVMGQMKYDLRAPMDAEAREWGVLLGISSEDELVTLGSLREGEDDQWIPEIPGLLGRFPKLKLLLAPRHIKNAGLFQRKLAQVKVSSVLRSRIKSGDASQRVLVMDTVGELSLAYHLSRVAFVGGTLVPIGGHNVMEPALSAVPVLFGPHTQNVSEAADLLLARGGGFQANSARELVPTLTRLLDPAQSRSAGEKARQAVSSLQGATQKNLDAVLAYLPAGFLKAESAPFA
jgi:3-deoxy-D-manno-octulosonic-acid transferase